MTLNYWCWYCERPRPLGTRRKKERKKEKRKRERRRGKRVRSAFGDVPLMIYQEHRAGREAAHSPKNRLCPFRMFWIDGKSDFSNDLGPMADDVPARSPNRNHHPPRMMRSESQCPRNSLEELRDDARQPTNRQTCMQGVRVDMPWTPALRLKRLPKHTNPGDQKVREVGARSQPGTGPCRKRELNL